MGCDGAIGVQSIHKYGGTVIVQDPHTAKFSSMPYSSIKSDDPDKILSPLEIAETLSSLMLERADIKKQLCPFFESN